MGDMVINEILTIAFFTFQGFLGAFVSVLFKSRNPQYMKSWKAVKRYITGAVVGYIFYFLHSEYNFPNAITCFVFGYAGEDIIKNLVEIILEKRRK